MASDTVHSALRTPGRGLDLEMRTLMESAFCADFSRVQIHDDAEAGASARDVGARAYTVGRHIVFAPGGYRPSDPAGRALLAHELSHVTQQPAGANLGGPIAIGATDTPAEREAEAASQRFAAGLRAPAGPSPDTAPVAGRVLRRQLAPWGVPPVQSAYPGGPTTDGKPMDDKGLSSELSNSPAAATSAERVFAWLRLRAWEIGALESYFGVDRRAIAGVVAWEALCNVRGVSAGVIGRFVGAGKNHTRQDKVGLPGSGEFVASEVEELGLLPSQTVSERWLALAGDSLPYIAAGMRMAADISRGYGIDISTNPAMLTWFWVSQTGVSFIDRLSMKTDRKFDTSKEEMPTWVMANMGWLSSAVGESQLAIASAGVHVAPVNAQPKRGTLETASWTAPYELDARLPKSREFLVNAGQVVLTISADSDQFRAAGYPIHVVLHRRTNDGSDKEIGDTMVFKIGSEATFTWPNLVDGLYFLEVFSYNGVPVRGEMAVVLGRRPPLGQPAQVPTPAVLQRAPEDEMAPTTADAGMADAGVAAPAPSEGRLRASAARELVGALQRKKAIYGHELDASNARRRADWWWGETNFDCSKFVLWILAGRKVGDSPLGAGQSADEAIRKVITPEFGPVGGASAVSQMIRIIDQRVNASPVDKERSPRIGDLMLWGGHVAIVVEVQPTDTGDAYIVYANMGVTGAGMVGVDAKGYHWLKASKVADYPNLAAGEFKGYWTP